MVWILTFFDKKIMKSLEEAATALQHVNISRHILQDDGTYPNNGLLPLLIYGKALQTLDAGIIENMLESNRWLQSWRGGIYDYHHYHSTAHEVLAVFSGSARVQFGGPTGVSVSLEQGDVVIIPAGVAHKCLNCDADFQVVGAYPEGQNYNILKGDPDDRPAADENIKNTELPTNDPIYGLDGPLLKNWQG
jgi:uncharacterized protein YjlB